LREFNIFKGEGQKMCAIFPSSNPHLKRTGQLQLTFPLFSWTIGLHVGGLAHALRSYCFNRGLGAYASEGSSFALPISLGPLRRSFYE
ncbi:15968_t:CDS:1, partial [Cetraspora pellucida]